MIFVFRYTSKMRVLYEELAVSGHYDERERNVGAMLKVSEIY